MSDDAGMNDVANMLVTRDRHDSLMFKVFEYLRNNLPKDSETELWNQAFRFASRAADAKIRTDPTSGEVVLSEALLAEGRRLQERATADGRKPNFVAELLLEATTELSPAQEQIAREKRNAISPDEIRERQRRRDREGNSR